VSEFETLNPAVQYHIVNSLGWRELRPFQNAVIPPILSGQHIIILAPTAGGKTEAALFPVLSRMVSEDWRGLSVLYICPIKALLNNLEIRLRRYYELLGRRAALWHGDITDSKKKKILGDSPDCLLTTPESLEVMLTSKRVDHKVLFQDVRVVIIDEIHAFAGDDRGWHLLAVLERIAHISENRMHRIGLSATVGNPEVLAQWLTCNSPDGHQVYDGSEPGGGEADVRLDYVGSLHNAALVISRLNRGEKRLVFVDSRSKAEQLTSELQALEIDAYVTHSSLSKDERLRAEHAFSEKEDCVIVATSVLELGIDVGDLDRVIQIDAPTSVGAFLQRMGRTGRRSDTRRNCLFLALTEESLLHAAGLLSLWEQGYVESLTPPAKPYHVLAQQMMALALQQGGIGKEDWRHWIGQYCESSGLKPGHISDVIAYMVKTDLFWEDEGLLWFGQKGEQEFGRRNFMEILSMVSGDPLFRVLHGSRDLGVVHHLSFVAPKGSNPVILLAGKSWNVQYIDWDRRKAYVEPSLTLGKSRWVGVGQPLSFIICQAIRSILEGDKVPTSWSRRAQDQIELLRQEKDWLRPDYTTIDIQESQTRWWTFAGDAINRVLSLIIGETFGYDVKFDSLFLIIRGTYTGDQLDDMASRLRNMCSEGVVIPSSEEMINGLKFNRCLPTKMAQDIINTRSVNEEDLHRIVSMPIIIV